MKNSAQLTLAFVTGLGLGAGLALCFAPKSGEETREQLAETAEDSMKRLRKTSKRAVENLQDAVAQGEQQMCKAIDTGRDALETLSAKLD